LIYSPMTAYFFISLLCLSFSCSAKGIILKDENQRSDIQGDAHTHSSGLSNEPMELLRLKMKSVLQAKGKVDCPPEATADVVKFTNACRSKSPSECPRQPPGYEKQALGVCSRQWFLDDLDIGPAKLICDYYNDRTPSSELVFLSKN